MSDADEDEIRRSRDPSRAEDIALAAVDRRKAEEYLDEQIALTRLQRRNLVEQNRFELSHLRWRRLNDQMRGALQIMAVLVGLVLVGGLGALLWTAHEARGLVVQPLRTPPDFAAKGLDGTVLAERLLDKLNGLVAESEPLSYRSADAIQGNWGDDSKVEIPETGVSLGELTRTLRGWLGSETQAGGEVWRTPDGIAVTVRAGANPAVTVTGSDAQLDALLDRAAEKLLAQTQPYRYAAVLLQRSRFQAALDFVIPIARGGPRADRAWALIYWGNTLSFMGRNRELYAPLREALKLAPNDVSIYFNLGGADTFLSHDEALFADIAGIRATIGEAGAARLSATAVAAMRPLGQEVACEISGDYACAMAEARHMQEVSWYGYQFADLLIASNAARAHDPAAADALLAAHPDWNDAAALFQSEFTDVMLPHLFVALERQDWPRAVAIGSAVERDTRSLAVIADLRHTRLWPLIAYALARSGNQAAAQGLVARTAPDCDFCLLMRGRIAEARGDVAAAAYWYGRNIADAPSSPFAYADWGEMLLRHGDFDGAIARFAAANRRGPHFADPLELWGEALVAKNRSDLALGKFSEAARYAPNWGRLHLKWGEALLWLGRRDDARREFSLAAGLDLPAPDARTLQQLRARF